MSSGTAVKRGMLGHFAVSATVVAEEPGLLGAFALAVSHCVLRPWCKGRGSDYPTEALLPPSRDIHPGACLVSWHQFPGKVGTLSSLALRPEKTSLTEFFNIYLLHSRGINPPNSLTQGSGLLGRP